MKKQQKKHSTSNKKNKTIKKVLRLASFLIVVAIVIAAIVFFIPKSNGSYNWASVRGYFTAKSYLDHIIDQNYEKAIRNVWLYDGSVENASQMDSEQALSVWSERIEQSRQNLDYLADYDSLKVFLRDGQLVGTVKLVVQISGVDVPYSTELVFYNGKIADITTESIKTDVEQNVSGDLG